LDAINVITSIPPSRILFAAIMIALGITGLVNGEFARGFQIVPIHHFPGLPVFAYATAIIEVLIGVGLFLRPTLTMSCRALFIFMLLWLVLLELPWIARAPLVQEPWASASEIGIITAGAWCLFAAHAGAWEREHLGFMVGDRGIRAARALLVLSLPMIGLDVLVHTYGFSYEPWLAWLPYPSAWIHLTGICSIAAFLGLLFSVFPRLAATMEAVMLGLITILFWGPDLHTGQTATTAFVISALIAAGVWLVANTYRNVPWLATGRASRGISIE
jgi:hypothetical protein